MFLYFKCVLTESIIHMQKAPLVENLSTWVQLLSVALMLTMMYKSVDDFINISIVFKKK